MLDKIVISKDKKQGRVYFDTHSIGFHSDENVLALIYDMVIEPSIRLEAHCLDKERRYLESLEKTVEIDLQLSLKDVA